VLAVTECFHYGYVLYIKYIRNVLDCYNNLKGGCVLFFFVIVNNGITIVWTLVYVDSA